MVSNTLLSFSGTRHNIIVIGSSSTLQGLILSEFSKLSIHSICECMCFCSECTEIIFSEQGIQTHSWIATLCIHAGIQEQEVTFEFKIHLWPSQTCQDFIVSLQVLV